MKVFHWPVRVYYEDTDSGGVVYHANHLKFFERARTEMLRSMGFEQDILIAEQKLIFAVRSIQIDYLKPARFNESLDVTAEVTQVKKTSFNFEQSISRNDLILCKGSVRIACLDVDGLKPKRIPDNILQQII